jgi:hemerythrin-like domain-containing protein
LLKRFDRLYQSCRNLEDWEALRALCADEFEANHHRKEEEFIFSAVRTDPRIRAGGPLCTLYFDHHMIYSALKLAQKTVKEVVGLELKPEWSQDLQEDQTSNSPLTIPGEDHEAGRILVRAAEHLLNQSGGSFNEVGLQKIFSVYRDIQASHFQREENCFMKMCKNLVPPSRWTELAELMSTKYKFLGE